MLDLHQQREHYTPIAVEDGNNKQYFFEALASNYSKIFSKALLEKH
jgi:hypothetical protein